MLRKKNASDNWHIKESFNFNAKTDKCFDKMQTSFAFAVGVYKPTFEDDDDFKLLLEECVSSYFPEWTGLRDLMDDGRRPDEEDEIVSDARVSLEVERELTQRNRLAFLRLPSIKSHNSLQSLSIHHKLRPMLTIHTYIRN